MLFSVSQDHWRTPEFPLARLKKIMRMDEDVKVVYIYMYSVQ